MVLGMSNQVFLEDYLSILHPTPRGSLILPENILTRESAHLVTLRNQDETKESTLRIRDGMEKTVYLLLLNSEQEPTRDESVDWRNVNPR